MRSVSANTRGGRPCALLLGRCSNWTARRAAGFRPHVPLWSRPSRCIVSGDMSKRESWNKRYGATDLVWGAEPNRFVEEALRDVEPRGRALDVACGEGRNAIWLAERGWRTTAVDFSGVAIERGRKLAARRGLEVVRSRLDLLGTGARRDEGRARSRRYPRALCGARASLGGGIADRRPRSPRLRQIG